MNLPFEKLLMTTDTTLHGVSSYSYLFSLNTSIDHSEEYGVSRTIRCTFFPWKILYKIACV
jgi:hypothetical protein